MGTSDGQVLGVTRIVEAGPPEQSWNIVIVSEGYRSDEMAQFRTDAKQFADTLLAAAPFDRFRAAINIYRVDVKSTESGAKDQRSATVLERSRAPTSMPRFVQTEFVVC